jgi:hypothetical protein
LTLRDNLGCDNEQTNKKKQALETEIATLLFSFPQYPNHASLGSKRHPEAPARIEFKPIQSAQRCRRKLLRLILNKRHPWPPRRQPDVSQSVEPREELKEQYVNTHESTRKKAPQLLGAPASAQR